jgi:SAM-dependent methyltransferase
MLRATILPMLRRGYQRARYWAKVFRQSRNTPPRECPLCGFRGRFVTVGLPPRFGALCPKCKSLERHRLIYLALQSNPISQGASILHFAPEPVIADLLRRFGTVKSADIRPGRADLTLDIERLDVPSASFNVIVANHVLEHVDDSLALPELFRVLTPGGVLITTVPLVEGWDSTYENAAVTSPADRLEHFGQSDHVRYYGRDFRDQVRRFGLSLSEFTGTGDQSARYGLLRGERVFFGSKPSPG